MDIKTETAPLAESVLGSDFTKATLPIVTSAIKQAEEGSATSPAANKQQNFLRVTNSLAQYDCSFENPHNLANLALALAGSLDRNDLTFVDPETKQEVKLGDVFVAVDLSDPEKIVLRHHDSAGKGALGRVLQSLSFINEHPFKMLSMKLLGVAVDPEVIYRQKIIQTLAQLDREGLFGPPGASTFNLADWEVETSTAWRDVIVSRAKPKVDVPLPSFGEAFKEAFGAMAA